MAKKPSLVAVVTRAFVAAGKTTTIKSQTSARFDIDNPSTLVAAQKHGAALVTGLKREARKAVATVIQRGIADHVPPKSVAIALRSVLGLSGRQTTALMNARAAWAEAGVAPVVLDKKVTQYGAKLLRQRALTVARTESVRAVSQGQLASWQSAADDGLLQRHRTSRQWRASPGACKEICEPMDDQVVPFDAPFLTPDGEPLMAPPAHPSCRCTVRLVFDRS